MSQIGHEWNARRPSPTRSWPHGRTSGQSRRQPLGPKRLLGVAWRLALATAIVSACGKMAFDLYSQPWALFDYRGDLYNAATAILHGHSPYRPGVLAHLAAMRRHYGVEDPVFAVPVYPAPILVAAVPFGLLPMWLGGVIFVLLSAGALVWGLRLLGVTDWRCLALALVSWPALFGLWLGTLSPLLVLGCAIVWRSRDRAVRCAATLTAMVLAKLFPWPLLIWPAITRRWRTLALVGVMALAASLGAWALIGFHSLVDYPHMLSTLSYVEQHAGVSLCATLISFGLSPGTAAALALLAAGALLLVAWRVARRPGGAPNAFGLVVIAALTASPLVWAHYEVLLFVPIALLSPTLSAIWFVPVLSAIVPWPHFHAPAEMLMWPVLQAVLVVQLCRPVRPAFGAAAVLLEPTAGEAAT